MSEQGWREFLSADGVDSGAPGAWVLADRAGNKVCIAAWPDGAPTPESDEAAWDSACLPECGTRVDEFTAVSGSNPT